MQDGLSGVPVMRRDPQRDARVVAEIETLVQSGNLPSAIAAARNALDVGVVHPMLLNLRSTWHLQNGRTKDAQDDLRTAMAIAPNDVFVRNALAILLGWLGQWDEARSLLEGSIKIEPNFAPAHFSLGWVHEFTGELDKAKLCFEAAAQIDPRNPDPLAHLASLAYRRADWNAAESLADQALAIGPRNAVALITKAGTAIAQKRLDDAEAQLQRLPNIETIEPTVAALAESTFGDLRDAQKRYPEAFEFYTRRNRRKFSYSAPHMDHSGHTAYDYVKWLAAYFEPRPAGSWVAPVVPSNDRGGARGHAFLVSFPRSGTTLLENVLASHPDVCTLDERDTLGPAALEFLSGDDGLDRLANLDAETAAHYRDIYWQRVRDFGTDVRGKVFVDKYPLSSIKLPVVAKLFPDARILFALRDPRDVLLSCYRRSFSINTSMFELLDLQRGARFYDAVMGLSAIYRERFDLAWHDVVYEALVADFEGEVRKICEFLGISWNEQMNDFARLSRQRTIKTPSSIQVVRGLYSDGREQWRRYEPQIAPIFPVLAPWLRKWGYAEH